MLRRLAGFFDPGLADVNGGVVVMSARKAPSREAQIMRSSRSTQTARAGRKTARKSARSPAPKRSAKAGSRVLTVRSPAAPARSSKKAAIVALLQRPSGAAISDLAKATGWQVHSVRAALTGLRKEGKILVRNKDAAGITYYRLAANA